MHVDARSALFDLYGDHLRSRGSRAPVAALVRLLAPLGITAPAVRTAISRMVRQGWLEAVRLPEGPGYELTPRAIRRLDEAAERIYRVGDPEWDGRWHLVVIERVRERTHRDRLRAALSYLGYAPIDETTWVSPRASRELEALLEAERVRAERFVASYDGDARGLVARAWDLDGLSHAYQGWLDVATSLVAPAGPARPTRSCSRRAADLSTNGGNFCSGTRACPPSCCPASGLATEPPTCSMRSRPGCSQPPPASWTAACGTTTRGEASSWPRAASGYGARGFRGAQLLVRPDDLLRHVNEVGHGLALVAAVRSPPRGGS